MAFILNAPSTIGSRIGQGFGAGFSGGLSNTLDQYFTQKKQQQETSALQKAFTSLPENASFEEKFKTIMSAPGVGIESKKLALSNLTDYEKMNQMMKLEEAREKNRLATEERRTEEQGKRELQKERTKTEYESPEIKEYRKNLGLREETATQLAPALENARQYKNDPSRFIPGTAANKTLGDLSTRAFAFYKPLFGGRLTQREFVNSISNLAANKAFPGGYEQAMNLIESMIMQATKEADLFSQKIDEGLSPYEARRQTLKEMRANANEIVDILKGKGEKKETSIKKVEKGTKITQEQAQDFLQKANGDKEKARQLARQMGYEF